MTVKTKATKAATRTNIGMRTATAVPLPPTPPKASQLRISPDAPGDSHDQITALLAVGGIVGNARTLTRFGAATFGDMSLTECAAALKETAQGFNAGDLSAAVTMLSSQAVALNAMFGELARRSAHNMGEYLDASERYMRLALKAQGQCRATLETLAVIKSPPLVFARQANINNGGQQQVNNGVEAATGGSHASKSEIEPNKLMEASHGERLDSGTQAAAIRTHPNLEPVEMLNRSSN